MSKLTPDQKRKLEQTANEPIAPTSPKGGQLLRSAKEQMEAELK